MLRQYTDPSAVGIIPTVLTRLPIIAAVGVGVRNWINGNSGRNYQLMDEESTGGMVDYSAGNYQFMDEESTGRMVIPPGIISSGTRNRPEEWDSTGISGS
jgi:hypothetical protein